MAIVRPSSCWTCHVLFEEDEEFRLSVFRSIRENGTDATREMVDEHYAEVHEDHSRSWV